MLTNVIDTAHVMCFYTDISIVDVHFHSCYQIVVSTKTTFDSVIEGREYKGLNGFIIDKYTRHSCYAPSGNFLIYYIESRSPLGKRIKGLLGGRDFIDIETVLSKDVLNQLSISFTAEVNIAEIKLLSDHILGTLFSGDFNTTAEEKLDSRIKQAITFINENIGESITLEAVANHIYLSPERTRHLFLEQIEIPFSQYLLWKRIKAVLSYVLKEHHTFYDAALQYGFSDQSHFNRFFKRMFGISATIILKNSRFIQFIYPEL